MRIQRNPNARTKAFLLTVLFALLPCCDSASSSSPTAAVKKFYAALNGGNVYAVVHSYSTDWIKRNGGLERAVKNSELVVALTQDNIKRSGHTPELHNVREIIDGDKADVAFEQGAPGESGGFPAVIHLVKEDGEWKINDGDVSISPSVQPH